MTDTQQGRDPLPGRPAATSSLPPPPPPPTAGTWGTPPTPTARPPKGRPKFGFVVAAAIGLRLFRDVAERVAASAWGVVGVFVVGFAAIAFVIGWRLVQRRKAAQRGGEITPEIVAKQLEDSGLLPPAYPEDGTIAGASIVVMDQLPKVLEVETGYELFGSDAQPIGRVRQIGQSRWKQAFRVVTAFDQFFTHHFEIRDLEDRDVLRVTRPAKVFLSRLEVFDADDRYLGKVKQQNVFWKINFQLVDAVGNVVGHLRAKNVRAWDFHVEDAYGREVATVVKSWEGWARTAWTRADRYVLRIHEPLPVALHPLVLAVPLTIDVALKQDARGLG